MEFTNPTQKEENKAPFNLPTLQVEADKDMAPFKIEKKPDTESDYDPKEKVQPFVIQTGVLIIILVVIALGLLAAFYVIPPIVRFVKNPNNNTPIVATTTQTIDTQNYEPVIIGQIATTSAPVQNHPVTTVSGIPDLAITIISVSAPDAVSSRITVIFNVFNRGSANSGAWSFTADLPSQSDPHYTSDVQPSLAPQHGMQYTMSFDRATTLSAIKITVDPQNSVKEESKANNTATVSL